MKILHVQAQLPAKTGSGVYFSNVIKGFKYKYEQACVFGYFGDFEYTTLPKDHQYPLKFPNEKCNFPLPGMSDVMPYKSTVYGEMTPEMIKSWQDAFRETLQKAVTDFKPDVILCHHLWFLTSLICQEYPDIPTYVFCHGTDLRQAKQHPDLKQKYVTDLDKLNQVFALSHQEIQQLHDTFDIPKEKITVIGGGFDPNIFYPAHKEKKDTIDLVYAGKLSKPKGTVALLKVFDRISKKYPNVDLHLIGAVSDKNENILDPYLKNKQIKFYNVLNQQELADKYRQFDIFILPSYYEGLGLGAIEALACDLRVVVTNITNLKEQLGSTVNDSGYISYVDLPRLINQDEPVEEDLPAFYDRLQLAIEDQILRVQEKPEFTEEVQQAILNSSWPQLIETVDDIITKEKAE